MISLPVLFFSCGRVGSLLLNTIFLVILLIDGYVTYTCKLVVDSTLDAIIGTNPHEAASMLGMVHWPAYIVAFLLFCGVATLSWRLGRWNGRMIMIALIPLLLSGFHDIWKVYSNIKPFMTTTWSDRGYREWMASILRNNAPGVMGDIAYIGVIISEQTGIADRRYRVIPHTMTDPQVIGRHAGRVHNIIFVMGESSLATHYSVYGYKEQDTTPNLQNMTTTKQLCTLSNVHSNANMTRNSVPMTFSFQTPENRGALVDEKNIIEMAHDNGYKTFWISSQEGTGVYARPFGYLSEYSDYTTRSDYNNQTSGVNWTDESLIPALADKLQDPAEYKLYVIHIMGSHGRYEDKIIRSDVEALPNADAYDQSIHHTDSLLQRIMAMAAADLGDYTLLYTSDHGEVVGVGHALQYGGYDQYIVPMIIHDSNGRGTYCDMAEHMRNQDGYYTSIMNKYLLLNMLGYDIDPAAIKSVQSTDHILHSDAKIYDYSKLPTAQHPH